jgi:hypothetical protein
VRDGPRSSSPAGSAAPGAAAERLAHVVVDRSQVPDHRPLLAGVCDRLGAASLASAQADAGDGKGPHDAGDAFLVDVQALVAELGGHLRRAVGAAGASRPESHL